MLRIGLSYKNNVVQMNLSMKHCEIMLSANATQNCHVKELMSASDDLQTAKKLAMKVVRDR